LQSSCQNFNHYKYVKITTQGENPNVRSRQDN